MALTAEQMNKPWWQLIQERETQLLLAELDEIEALQAAKAAREASQAKEEQVEVLVDSVCYNKKPAGNKTIAAITKRLPQNKKSMTLEDLAQAAADGRSWKASVLSDTNNGSFVSSSLVALDIDNKESYTSISDFLVGSHKYQPCFVYETFSSTEEHNRFRVVYAFDRIITDYNEMVALYEEVKAQYPTVEIDPSVDPGKILFGGKTLNYFNNTINETPVLEVVKAAPKTSKSSNVKATNNDSIVIDKDTILRNLSDIAYKYEDVQEIDINEAYEWVNKNVKITDAFKIKEDVRYRCLTPGHEDAHPSARVTTCGDEQVYMCSCSACGYRLISLLSKVLDMSEVKVKFMILNTLNISYGSEYQKATERYIADLRRNVNKLMPQDLQNYLNKRKLYRTYRLIIDFADNHITFNSLSNDDKVVFFLSKRHLKEEMKQNFISGNAGEKLITLCELGFLRKLTDSEIRRDALNKAYEQKSASKTLNRIDFYELVDLSPSMIKNVQDRIQYMEDNYVRQKNNNINRRVNVLGIEEVTSHINVQTKVNTKKQDKIETKLRSALNNLLENNNLFNESDLAIAYRSTDKKHITKKEAEQIVLDFIPVFSQEELIIRIRVNKETRKQYNIPSKYISNSFVYIKAC